MALAGMLQAPLLVLVVFLPFPFGMLVTESSSLFVRAKIFFRAVGHVFFSFNEMGASSSQTKRNVFLKIPFTTEGVEHIACHLAYVYELCGHGRKLQRLTVNIYIDFKDKRSTQLSFNNCFQQRINSLPLNQQDKQTIYHKIVHHFTRINVDTNIVI